MGIDIVTRSDGYYDVFGLELAELKKLKSHGHHQEAHVVIVLSGGVVQSVIVDDQTIKAYLIDWDAESDPPTIDIDGDPVYAYHYPASFDVELTKKFVDDIEEAERKER